MTTQFSKWKRWQKIALGIVGSVFLLMVLVALFAEDEQTNPKTQSLTIEENAKIDSLERKKRIENQFSSWDGDHTKLKEYIKNNLKDPDSYKNIKTVYFDNDSLITVKTEYTATNSFGGRVRSTIMAQCDLDGNVLNILYSQ